MNPPTSLEQFLCFDKKINITSHTISWKKIYSGDSNFEFSKFALMILLMIHHYEKGGKDKLLAEAMWVVISLYLLIQLGIGIHDLIYTHLSRKIDIDQIISVQSWNDGESNTYVKLTMKSTRQKTLCFRTLEKEYLRFLEYLKTRNPEIRIS